MQAEFGPFDSPTVHFHGIIVEIHWHNPHVYIDLEVTGGEIAANEVWRIESHPVTTMNAYGFASSDFMIGDTVSVIGWKSRRDSPVVLARAVQLNGGQMRSCSRYRDMIDIANGAVKELKIIPARNLDGAPPEKAGAETVNKLHQMGLLDENGLFIWPSTRVN